MLFRDIIAVYFENHKKPINTCFVQELLTVKTGCTYSYHWRLTVSVDLEEGRPVS
jgi:hypothetical protein